MFVFVVLLFIIYNTIITESKGSSTSILSSKSMNRLTIVIGNKSYSSWSMRPWLALRYVSQSKSDFDEIICPLAGYGASTERLLEAKKVILHHSPTGKVPALYDRELDITICDSVAIMFHIIELFPNFQLLPNDIASKSKCISACMEMHSGFTSLRQYFSFNCLMKANKYGAEVLESKPDLLDDINRLCILFTELRQSYGGDGLYLFNHYTIADCMFAPIAIRFNTYCSDYNQEIFSKYPIAVEYLKNLYNHPHVQEWIEDAKLEDISMKIPQYEEHSD